VSNYLLLDLIVLVILEIDKLALVVEAFERHHITAANLEAATAANTFLGIDREQIFWLPFAAIAGCI
jgi:hypothetical protein